MSVAAWAAALFLRVRTVQGLMHEAAQKPRLVPLTDVTRVPVKTETPLTAFGWSMGIPNTAVAKRTDIGAYTFVKFDDGSSLGVLHDRSPISKSTLEQALHNGDFREAETRSPYELERTALSEDFGAPLHVWQSERHIFREAYLAVIGSVPLDRKAVHPVWVDQARGFEFVAARKGTLYFMVDLYGNHGDVELLYKPRQQAPDPQAELNTLLASVHAPA